MHNGRWSFIRRGLLAAWLLPSVAFAQLVIYDPFDDGDRFDGADAFDTSWFLSHPDLDQGGAAPAVINIGTLGPLDGNVLAFGGPSTYAFGVGAFAPVTLSTPGDIIIISVDFSVPGGTEPSALYGPNIGLFNHGGTPLTADITALSNQATHDDVGYELIYERGASGNLLLVPVDNSTFEADFAYGTRTPAVSWSPGAIPDGNGHNFSLALILAGNGTDLIAIATFDDFTGDPLTLTGAALLGYTFNEALIGPWSGSTGYIDNVTVMYVSAVPEPAASALLAGGLALGWLVRRRKRLAATA